jgi:aminocarboxymuconate-semialdehyde decarboxylase
VRANVPRGRIDVHTHAIAPDLAAPGPGRWPTGERTAGGAADNLHLGAR